MADRKKKEPSNKVLHCFFGSGRIVGSHTDKNGKEVLDIQFDSLDTVRSIMADFGGMVRI